MRRPLLALAILLVSLVVGGVLTVAQAWWSCRPDAMPAGKLSTYATQLLTVGRATLPNKQVTFTIVPGPGRERREFQVSSSPGGSLGLVPPAREPTWADHAAARGPTLGWPQIPVSDYVLDEYRIGWPADAMVRDEVFPRPATGARPFARSEHQFLVSYVGRNAFVVPTGILPLGFALNTAFYSAPIWFPLVLWTFLIRPVRRRFRLRQRRCPACGYDPGTPTATCPECGHRLAPSASPSLPQSPTQVSDS